MNKKTIGNVVRSKMQAWLGTLPEELRNQAMPDVIVTGGCIASMLLREEVNDFDVYFRTKATAKAVAQHYCNEFNKRDPKHLNKLGGKAQAFVLDGADVAEWKEGKRQLSSFAPGYENQGGEEWREGGTWSHMITNCEPDRIKVIVRSDGIAEAPASLPSTAEEALSRADEVPAEVADDKPEPEEKDDGPKFRPVFLTTNAITLSGKVQLVVRFQGEPDVIHENYDYVHCTNYWTFGAGLVLRQPALEALMAKELRYIGSKYPLCSIIRTRKFIKRGFHINAGQFLKMGFQLSQLDLTDIDVLEEQLLGVDTAYFNLLIDALRAEAAKDPNFRVDSEYVATVVDRIF